MSYMSYQINHIRPSFKRGFQTKLIKLDRLDSLHMKAKTKKIFKESRFQQKVSTNTYDTHYLFSTVLALYSVHMLGSTG